MLYPTYSVNGTPLADSLGRWHEHPDMSVLPTFPGLRSASLNIVGVGGEYALPQASAEPVDFVVRVVVNAVNASGVRPPTYAGRLQAIRANTSILLRDMRASAMTQGGLAEIKLHLSETEVQTATGRLEASVEAEFVQGRDYAELTFVFRIPSGVWRGKTINERINAVATERIVGLKDCTAPVDGPRITLAGPFTYIQVTNQYGNGFRLNKTLTNVQAVTVDTAKWMVSDPFAVSPGAVNVTASPGPYKSTPDLVSVGRTSGVALTLLPEPTGAPIVFVGTGRLSGTTAAFIHTSEAFF